jgi:hypothetical protein
VQAPAPLEEVRELASGEVKDKPKAEKMPRASKTEVVHIISYPGKNIVWPPVVVLDGGDTVQFRAVGTDATIFLQNALSFEGMTEKTELFKVPKKYVLEIKVKPDVVASDPLEGLTPGGTEAVAGVYPYSVYCSKGHDFAIGNSSPVMIIEPPEDDPSKGGG